MEFNEIVLPWKKIAKFYPEDVIILIVHTRKVFGDLIYEAEGKVTNMRVVSVEYDMPKIEVTILQNVLLIGVEITSIVSVHRGG